MSENAPTTSGGSASSRDRSDLFGAGGLWLAKWSAVLLVVSAALWIAGWLVGQLWVIMLPVLLALVVATVLWPPTRLLRRIGFPPALAALTTLVGFLAVLAGVVAFIVPSVISQAPDLADSATLGVSQVQEWLEGPPVNLDDEQIDNAVQAIVTQLQDSGTAIASGVFAGVATAGSILVTLGLVLVLSFFFIKDGPRFLPWLHGLAGRKAGGHLAEVLRRVWDTLGGFIRTQAIVSAIDAIFIGIGLLILGVPLTPVLMTLTFLGGFIPIVGAFVAGALAVLVALVANGFTTAVIVLAIILAVQQIEGNVLQPILQSKSMNLHAAIVLLAVTAGGSIFGIIGAFLAVPVAAATAVLLRYINEQIELRSDEDPGANDIAERIHDDLGTPGDDAPVVVHDEKTRYAPAPSDQSDDVAPTPIDVDAHEDGEKKDD
ncbi:MULTISPECIES: AI-2E family transporter [Nocardiaceae]|uniref:PurR-regulated permease PerM n=1 Tax=Rhodococcoides corynebacterioides TaxID=53972 RepID=A0ABS2KPV3_9NOCA|nr:MULTISPECIES: AI-2E family transporter [Rhodococcus]MBM7413977.1 putative PurR-regulated permease PerM [Rhodococcus corynebacterioides]MBP1116440.1 putative PurR-regulated permease PerM [Rhodococcus sp. PvP016]